MVSLWPGMYTVDNRSRATWSSFESGAKARPGAAMWTPNTTVPLAMPCTDSASSISVVAESSIEKARTGASGNSSRIAGASSGGKPVPFGKLSNRKRRQWNWYGESIAPAPLSSSSGGFCERFAASTTALYSGAFLSGLKSSL